MPTTHAGNGLRSAVASVGLVALVGVAGCTSNSPASDGATTLPGNPATSASTFDTGVGDSAPPAGPSSAASTPATTPSSAAPTVATTASSAPPPANPHLPRCTSAELRVTALRGSGAQQKQYATVYVTDTGARSCWLVGYAAVSLRLGGAPLGSPATPAGSGQPAYQLAPGAAAQALVHGPSTCEAGVSDLMRISAPGQSAFTDVVVPMRGCTLTVDAFTPSTPH